VRVQRFDQGRPDARLYWRGSLRMEDPRGSGCGRIDGAELSHHLDDLDLLLFKLAHNSQQQQQQQAPPRPQVVVHCLVKIFRP